MCALLIDWMDGWMDGWMDRWVGGWVVVSVDRSLASKGIIISKKVLASAYLVCRCGGIKL